MFPAFNSPRQVPEALRGKIRNEREWRWEDMDIIERVNEPSRWVSRMVHVVKPNEDKYASTWIPRTQTKRWTESTTLLDDLTIKADHLEQNQHQKYFKGR